MININNLLKSFRTSIPSMFVCYALGVSVLSGCVAIQPSSEGVGQGNQPPVANSSATTMYPFIYEYQDRKNVRHIVKMNIHSWTRRGSKGEILSPRVISNGTPYIALVSQTLNSYSALIKLSDLQSIEWKSEDVPGKKPLWTGVVKSKVGDYQYKGASLLVCPTEVLNPNTSDCLVAKSGIAEIQYDQGPTQMLGYEDTIYTKLQNKYTTFTGLVFSCIVNEKVGQAIPEQDCPKGSSRTVFNNTDPIGLAETHKMLQKKAKEQIALQEERRLNEQRQAEALKQKQALEEQMLEKRKVDEILKKTKVGQRMFCESSKPIYPGTPLSDVTFYCDIIRDHRVTFNSLNDWDIVSDVRTPKEDRQLNAVLYHVSLALKKTKN